MDKFNYWIGRIVESGLVFKWVQDSAVDLPKYNFSHLEEDKLVALNFDHLLSVFVILISGLGVAILCFVAETVGKKPIVTKIK